VVYAANGREAVNYLRRGEKRVDIVFCDLMMPDMDGVEDIRHAADLPHKPSFVFISGETAALLGTAVDMGRARGLPVLGAIEKPVSIAAARNVLAAYGKSVQPIAAARPISLSVADLVRVLDRD